MALLPTAGIPFCPASRLWVIIPSVFWFDPQTDCWVLPCLLVCPFCHIATFAIVPIKMTLHFFFCLICLWLPNFLLLHSSLSVCYSLHSFMSLRGTLSMYNHAFFGLFFLPIPSSNVSPVSVLSACTWRWNPTLSLFFMLWAHVNLLMYCPYVLLVCQLLCVKRMMGCGQVLFDAVIHVTRLRTQRTRLELWVGLQLWDDRT